MSRKGPATAEPPQPESMMIDPKTASDYEDRGWLLYAQGEYGRAVEDLKESIRLDPDKVDAIYALGLALKAGGDGKAAIEWFKKAATAAEYLENRARGRMIRRLAIGHIHEIETGDWNLEKETWQKKP